MIGLIIMWGLRALIAYAVFVLGRIFAENKDVAKWAAPLYAIAACAVIGVLAAVPSEDAEDADPLFGGGSTYEDAEPAPPSRFPLYLAGALLVPALAGTWVGLRSRARSEWWEEERRKERESKR